MGQEGKKGKGQKEVKTRVKEQKTANRGIGKEENNKLMMVTNSEGKNKEGKDRWAKKEKTNQMKTTTKKKTYKEAIWYEENKADGEK